MESIGEISTESQAGSHSRGRKEKANFGFRNFSWTEEEIRQVGEPLCLSLLPLLWLSWLFPRLPLLHRLQCHRFTAGSERGATASARLRDKAKLSSWFQLLLQRFLPEFQLDLGSVSARKVRIFFSRLLAVLKRGASSWGNA